MATHRVHIDDLKIRMARGAVDPERLAAEIGREVVNAAARFSKGKTGKIEVSEIPIGKITMSDNVGRQITSTLNSKLDGLVQGGKK